MKKPTDICGFNDDESGNWSHPHSVNKCRCSRIFHDSWSSSCQVICDCAEMRCQQCECLDNDYAGSSCQYRVCRDADSGQLFCPRENSTVTNCPQNVSPYRTKESYIECEKSHGSRASGKIASDDQSGRSLSDGAIAGIVIGCIAVSLLIILLIIWFCCRRKDSFDEETPQIKPKSRRKYKVQAGQAVSTASYSDSVMDRMDDLPSKTATVPPFAPDSTAKLPSSTVVPPDPQLRVTAPISSKKQDREPIQISDGQALKPTVKSIDGGPVSSMVKSSGPLPSNGKAAATLVQQKGKSQKLSTTNSASVQVDDTSRQTTKVSATDSVTVQVDGTLRKSTPADDNAPKLVWTRRLQQ